MRLFVGMILGCVLFAAPALAETRVALVIGNAAYKHAPALANPRNDAEAMAASLKRLGFEVLAGTDLEKPAMERPLGAFAEKLEKADAALVFYAGLGIQMHGRNYLVPVGAKLDRPVDVFFETVPLDLVQQALDEGTRATCTSEKSCWVSRTKHCGTADSTTAGYVQWIGVYGTDAAAFKLCER